MLDGYKKGFAEGFIEEAMFNILCSLVKVGLIKSEEAVKMLNVTESALNEKFSFITFYNPPL